MTDRINIRDDDVEPIATALRMVKHVISVEPHVASHADQLNSHPAAVLPLVHRRGGVAVAEGLQASAAERMFNAASDADSWLATEDQYDYEPPEEEAPA